MTHLEELTPGGTQTYSKHPSRFAPGCPERIRWGSGCVVRGEDDRDYVDLVSALGAIILGYCDPDVDAAVMAQLGRGMSFSLATDLEAEVAELVCGMVPGAEMVRFHKNGADACDTAVRLARAVTGRQRVVTIGYHGKSDWTVTDTNPAGVPYFNRDLLSRARYGDLDALDEAFESWRGSPVGGRPACLIMEPVVAGNPEACPEGYLQACRDLCTRHGALLIFDEVVTGFRMALGGAQEVYGVQADLVASGKAMANGMPLSIVSGPRDLMRRLGPGDVFASTTFGGETLSLAAARATLTKLRAENVPEQLGAMGAVLMQAFTDLAYARRLHGMTRIVGYPQRPVVQWLVPELTGARFNAALLAHGFLYQGYFNLTLAHAREPGIQARLETALAAGLDAAAHGTPAIDEAA